MSAQVPAAERNNPAEGSTANVIYILYLVGLVVWVTDIVGVIMAYVNRGDAPEWVRSHYQFQIRTFWISLLYGVIALVTIFIIIGWFIALFTLVWLVVRCVKGMKYLARGEPYPNPTTWTW